MGRSRRVRLAHRTTAGRHDGRVLPLPRPRSTSTDGWPTTGVLVKPADPSNLVLLPTWCAERLACPPNVHQLPTTPQHWTTRTPGRIGKIAWKTGQNRTGQHSLDQRPSSPLFRTNSQNTTTNRGFLSLGLPFVHRLSTNCSTLVGICRHNRAHDRGYNPLGFPPRTRCSVPVPASVRMKSSPPSAPAGWARSIAPLTPPSGAIRCDVRRLAARHDASSLGGG